MSEKMKPISTKINLIRLFADLQVLTTYKTIKRELQRIFPQVTGGGVLDVGCGSQPYRFLFDGIMNYIGLDYNGSEKDFGYKNNLTVYYDGKRFPFEDKSFILVFHTEVVEHILDYQYFFSECYRVLKDNGKMLFTMPFMARYHYIPYDYWRFTPTAIKMILENMGFKNIDIMPRGNDIAVACYKMVSVFYRLLLSKKLAKIIFSLIISPVVFLLLIIGHLSIFLNLGSKDDTLGWCVTADR